MLGIGLNVSSSPPDLPATHLREHDPERRPRGRARPRCSRRSSARLRRAVGGRSSRPGASATPCAARPVRWDGGEGTAAGIDDTGALLVETGRWHASPSTPARSTCSARPDRAQRRRPSSRGRRPRPAPRVPRRLTRSAPPAAAVLAAARRRVVAAALAAAAAAAATAAASALREVLEQLARQRRRLAGHPHAGAVEHLAGLGRVGQGGRQQRRRQPAVLLAGGLNEPAGVAGVGAAARVHQQAQQALGLRPALHRVLLVHLARVLRQVPEPGRGLVAAADLALGQRLEQHLDALAALVARPAAHDLDRLVERLGVAQVADLGQRAQAQL